MVASEGVSLMTRPIIWAIATFGSLAVAATVAGERLAKLRPASSAPGTVPLAGSADSGPRAPAGNAGKVVVVHGDGSGHFTVETSVDGRRLRMLVDTGASIVALSQEDALAAGIRPFPSDYKERIATANGDVAVARVRIREIRVGEIYARDVEAVVVPAGRLGTSLLGMSFLRQLRGFDIAGNRLTLRG